MKATLAADAGRAAERTTRIGGQRPARLERRR